MGRGGAFAAGGGEAGGAGRAGGTVGMDVGRGIGFGAVAVGRVGAAASVGAAGRFAAVEETDVGFTAAMGRAALGAAAELVGRAVAAAVPAADAAEPAPAGVEMGFVVAVAARGAPLTDVGCDGIGFGVAAEDDEDVGAWLVAAAVDVTGLRDVVVALAADADEEAGAGVAAEAGVTAAVDEDAGADVAALAGVEAAAGASPDAKSAGSIIGANHVPEYAESAGAVAQEPVAAVSTCAEAGGGVSVAGGGGVDLAAVAREPVVAVSVGAAFTAFLEPVVAVSAVAAFRAFLEPLALLPESALIPVRMPLGEFATVGAALFGAPALEVRGAGPNALAAGLAVLTEARPGALGAADLVLWAVEAGRTGGIPKPAGEGEFGASEAEAAFVGGAAGAGTALDALVAVAEPFAVPCAGFTSLAAAAAPEIVPSSGSSVDSNWSNPSKSSESDSYDGAAIPDVPGIPAAAASLRASARRSGSPSPSRLSGSISSSPTSSGPACRDSGCAGPPDDDGVVPTGTLPSMGASTGRSVSGSKTGRDAASIISSLVDAASNANLPSTERAQPRSLAGSRFRSL